MAFCVFVALCVSLWLRAALCGSVWLCVALCGSVWLCVALCGSVWFFVVLCGSLCSFAFYYLPLQTPFKSEGIEDLSPLRILVDVLQRTNIVMDTYNMFIKIKFVIDFYTQKFYCFIPFDHFLIKSYRYLIFMFCQ